MKIGITGATGFIGKRLVLEHLKLGNSVRILSRKKVGFPLDIEVINGDLLGDPAPLNEFVNGLDVLYHCAAEIKEESKMFPVNVEGTKVLIQLAKGKVKHWVQLSSTGIYGPVMSGQVYETQPLNPTNTYEKSKEESDRLVIEAGNENFFTYSILRPSNVFGADMTNQSLFQLVKAVDKGYFFFIGSVGANANYVPVENVVHALILLANNKKSEGKIYNISDSMPIEKFITFIASFLNKPIPKIRIPILLMKTIALVGSILPKFPLTNTRVDALSNRVVYENDLIEQELEYNPIIPFEKGIENLVETYKLKTINKS